MEKKIKKKNYIGVYLQIIVSFIAIVLLILYFIVSNKLLGYLEIAVAVDLLLMGYNNNVVYNRKAFTIIYIIFGILLLGHAIWILVN